MLDPAVGASSFALLVALLAGGEAERRQFGFIEPGHDLRDLELARAELARCFRIGADDPEIDPWIAEARDDARAEVARLWSWITRTAAALRHHRTLSHQQIEALRGDDPI